jgi:hypothetical protein
MVASERSHLPVAEILDFRMAGEYGGLKMQAQCGSYERRSPECSSCQYFATSVFAAFLFTDFGDESPIMLFL